MGQTYQQAYWVIAWVGPSNEGERTWAEGEYTWLYGWHLCPNNRNANLVAAPAAENAESHTSARRSLRKHPARCTRMIKMKITSNCLFHEALQALRGHGCKSQRSCDVI